MFDQMNNIIKDTIDKLKSMLESDTVVGAPVTADAETTVLPISKMTVGFVTGSFDLKSKTQKDCCAEQPISAIGGGISVTPAGFLIISKKEQTFIPVSGEKCDKWADIIGAMAKKAFKNT
ncbi:MAG: hypothetical protein FWD49_04290 [Firmicutes bacterium]|nr:hypothetical protein [Bacillota bacterium]